MKNRRRTILSWILVITLLMTGLVWKPQEARAEVELTETVAESYIIYNATKKQVIEAKDADSRHYPASITKIMTALLVCEMANFKDVMIFNQTCMNEMTPDSSTLTPKAQVGEQMTVGDALYGMFYVSSNECACMLGIYVGGSTEKFAALMNKRAAELGMTGTHFMNAHGLHNQEHYTTAKDMAILFSAAMANKKFYAMATGLNYTIPATNMAGARSLTVSHKIVNGSIIYPDVIAGKTGRTPQAGRTLVTGAMMQGDFIVTVILKSDDNSFYSDTLRLLDFASGYMNGEYTAMDWVKDDRDMYVYKTERVNVRSTPCSIVTDPPISKMNYGEVVHQLATWNGWSKVELPNGDIAYIANRYLTPEDPKAYASSHDPSQTFPADVTTEAPTTTVQQETETPKAEETTDVPQTAPVSTETFDDSELPTISGEEKETKKPMTNKALLIVMIIAIVLFVVILVVAIAGSIKRKKRRRKKQIRRYWEQEFK